MAKFDYEDRWNPPTFRPATTADAILALEKDDRIKLDGHTYVIQKIFIYTERLTLRSGDRWQEFEIFCADTAETKFLEVEPTGSAVFVTDVAGLSLAEVGISDPDQLEAIVDAEGSLQGYAYEDDFDARFEFDGRKEDLWSVEFQRAGEWLCVEEWEADDSYEVSKGRVLPLNKIEVPT